MKKHLLLLTGFLCLLAVSVGADDDVLEGRHLQVHGQGIIQVTPDVAIVQLGVEHRAATVAEAMGANNEAVAHVLRALAEAHIADRDVQTMELNVHRRVQRTPRTDDGTGVEEEVFVVRNVVQARIRDLGHLGQVIDVAIAAGANQMRGLRFGLSEDRHVKDQAREAAVDDARHRAEQLARLHNVRLGRVLRIAEQDAGGHRPQAMLMRAADERGGTPISVGDLSFSADVEVIYELQD